MIAPCLSVFSLLSAVAALLAAALWLLSAWVKVPTVYVSEGIFAVSSEQPKKPQRVSPIVLALRKQSRFAALGAIFAAIAALLTIPSSLGLPGPAICW